MIAIATRRPAAPATTMHESSSTPWPMTSWVKTLPFPDWKAMPPTTPNRIPLLTSKKDGESAEGDAAGEGQKGDPDVVVKIWVATSDRDPMVRPRWAPWGLGSDTAR